MQKKRVCGENTMNIEKRIEKDMVLFEKNYPHAENAAVRDMAVRYYRDAQHYIKRRDLVTAFGCIAYAHGLIDALKVIQETDRD